MSISRIAHGAVQQVTTAAAVPYAGSSGNTLIMYASTNGTALADPAGWTPLASGSGGGMFAKVWTQPHPGGTPAAVTVTPSGGTPSKGDAFIEAWSSTLSMVITAAIGADTDATSTAFSVSSTLTTSAGDVIVTYPTILTSAGTYSGTATGPSIGQSGATLGTQVGNFGGTTGGGTISYGSYHRPVTTGTTGAATFTATGIGTSVNAAGVAAQIVLHEAGAANVAAVPPSFSLASVAPAVTAAAVVGAVVAAMTLTARQPILTSTANAAPAATAVTVTAPAPAVTAPAAVTAVAPGITVAAPVPTVVGQIVVSGGAAAGITFTASPPTLATTANVQVVGSIDIPIIARPAGIFVASSVSPPAVDVAWAAPAPVVATTGASTILPPAAGVAVSVPSPVVSGDLEVTAVATAATLAALPPVVTIDATPTAPAAVITVTAPAPQASTGSAGDVAAVAAGLAVAARAPAPVASGALTTPGMAVTITASAPVVSAGSTTTATTAAFTADTPAPVITGGTPTQVSAICARLTIAAPAPQVTRTLAATPAVRTRSVLWEDRTHYIREGRMAPVEMEHDPSDRLDYRWDAAATDMLGNTWIGNDSIIDATVTCSDPTITVTDVGYDQSAVVAWVSGGTVGVRTPVVAHITTLAGRAIDRTIWLLVRQR